MTGGAEGRKSSSSVGGTSGRFDGAADDSALAGGDEGEEVGDDFAGGEIGGYLFAGLFHVEA